MKILSLFVLVLSIVGCGGSANPRTEPSIAEYASWNLTVNSASPGVDTSPIITSNYRCSSLLAQDSGLTELIGFFASFTRENGRPRELKLIGFRPETLIVGQEITFGTGGGIQGGISDWLADTGPERDAAYDASAGGVRVIEVDGDRTTFEIDATFTNLAGNSFVLRGRYSFSYDKRAEFVSFNPCPAR
ncbi:hypothetical protein MCEMSE15_01100 [Fimbriimonadaceae bacterium]